MSVSIKTPEEQQKMREAGAAAASVLVMLEPYVKPGVSTDELNRICHEYIVGTLDCIPAPLHYRSEEHTSELQSLMRISYAVFCLKKKTDSRSTRRSTEHAARDRSDTKRQHT